MEDLVATRRIAAVSKDQPQRFLASRLLWVGSTF